MSLARSLVADPEILLLDEPLSALDHLTQSRIIADLRRWNEARGIPILYVTHSQREVFALGERALVLQGGAVIADGTPDEVLNTPAHPGVVQLAGFENVLDASVVNCRPDAGVTVARLSGTSVDWEIPLVDRPVGSAVRVAVRAGDILIATESPRGLSARNIVRGTIMAVSRQAATVVVQVDVGLRLEVHVTPTASERLDLWPGREVWVVVKTHSCHPVSAV